MDSCNGIRANFHRANSSANILESDEGFTRDIHPTIKITNITSSSTSSINTTTTTMTKTMANGHLRRSYLSVNLDNDDVVWKRKSEVNLNNKDENDFTHQHQLRNLQQQQQQCNKKNIYASQSLTNDFNQDHIITLPSTRRKCINTKAQIENNYLVWITPVAASLSIAIIVAALAGPQWLFTEERLSKSYLNETVYYKPRGDDSDFITKFTKSSLWILCTDIGNDNPQEYHCKAIDYFPNETYSPDPIDSTNAIQYAITSSTPSLLIANFIHIISYIMLMLAMFSNKHTIYFFVSGVAFIISGLLMLIGLILYISIFKAEVGSKLRPKSTLQPAVFSYRYGYSFILYIIGILLVFCSGILNVFLYTGFHNETTFGRPTAKQHHSPCFINYSKLRRVSHSQPSRRNSACNSPTPSRFVLRKDPNCNVHKNQLAKSLNQLYTEPAPDIAPFDAAYPVLTRNVSTATEMSPENKKDTLMHNICGIKKSFTACGEKQQSSNGGKNEKCVNREKVHAPKDIYYIEDDGDTDLSNIFVIEPLETFHRRRRGSLYGETPQSMSTLNVHKLRAFNSNHSLSDLDKVFPTNYHNLDTQYYDKLSSSSKIFNGSFGSRTLPRNFAQKNFCSGDDGTRRISASGIFLANNTFDNGKIEPPQPPSMPTYHPTYTLSNSHSNILDTHRYELSAPIWPKIIINSPAHRHNSQLPPPMSDNKFQQQRFRSNNINSSNNINGRKISNSCDNILNDEDEAFIMNGNSGGGGGGGGSKTFDLDQIEYERRKSHAALFDFVGHQGPQHAREINDDDGTPV